MSYILEALKKAELQRDIGQVPGLGSEHEKPPRQAGGRWVGVVVVFLFLNLVLLAWLLWPDASPDTEDGYGVGQVQPESVTRQPAQVRGPPPVAPAVETPVRPRAVVVEKLPAAAPVTSRPQPVAAAPVVEVPVPAEPVVEKAPAVQPPVVEEMASNKLDSLPVWPQIPAHLFQQLKGGIRLDVHVYSDLPKDRFVLINMQKYHVGDQLQEGPLLDEITSEGVILSFQGQQFRVRAQ